MSINRRALSLFLQLGSRSFSSQPLNKKETGYSHDLHIRPAYFSFISDIMQHNLCYWDRSRSIFSIASISSSTCWTLAAMRPTLYPEIFLTNHEPKPCNVAEEWRYRLHSEGNPKYRRL